MRPQRTNNVGARTGRLSKTAIANKDPRFDYCFKRREDVEAGNIVQEGWEAVRGPEVKETWENKYAQKIQARTKGIKQLPLVDTVLCRREKEATEYYEEYHNDKRRAQARLVAEATRGDARAMRLLDPDRGQYKNESKITGSNEQLFTQKAGPNMEAGTTEGK